MCWSLVGEAWDWRMLSPIFSAGCGWEISVLSSHEVEAASVKMHSWCPC